MANITIKIKRLNKDEKKELLNKYIALKPEEKASLTEDEYIKQNENQTLLAVDYISKVVSWSSMEEAMDFVNLKKSLNTVTDKVEINLKQYNLLISKFDEAIKVLKGSIVELLVEVFELIVNGNEG